MICEHILTVNSGTGKTEVPKVRIPTLSQKTRQGWGTCDLSRRCTHRRRAADGWSVTETTMGTVEVVVIEPRRELLISFI